LMGWDWIIQAWQSWERQASTDANQAALS
jgi:hypothetical protein